MEQEPEIRRDTLTIANTRIFEASKAAVFKAWSDPEIIRNWWGPNGFTNTFNKFEFTAGGRWELIMHGPNGANYPNSSSFKEIVDNERIVIMHESGPQFELTATFEDYDADRSLLTFEQRFLNEREFEQILEIVPEANEQNLNRMEVQVAKHLINPKPLLAREFLAPKNLVFEAFTKEEHLKHWWGAKNSSLEVKQLELRPNGACHYFMSMEGMQMWGKFDYYEVHYPDQLVFMSYFSDQEGNIASGPFPGPWPSRILNIWTFNEVGGKTVLTLRGAPFKATGAEINAYTQNIPSLELGFASTFDRLDKYLSQLKS